MLHRHVTFENAEGHELAGILDLPDAGARAFALFAHCFTGSKNLKATTHVSRALCASGIGVLRFDFTGLGESEGEFAGTTFSTNVADLEAAARWLETEHRAPALLVGHSLGGTAILEAALELPSVRAVATIGAPSHPAHVIGRFEEVVDEIAANGEAPVELAGRDFIITRRFLDDLERHPLPDALAQLDCALLVMHSPVDEVVGIDNASELFLAARHPKSFVSLDQADHLLTREDDARYAGRVLGAWAEKYLFGLAADEEPAQTAPGEVVARTEAASFRTEISAAGYRLVADEPAGQGGDDLGPSPYDLLSAALAACTTMTLRMYAKQENIALEAATARVRYGRVHAKDCADCEGADSKIDEFRRTLTLEGDMDEETRGRLMRIAERCPVHRTLYGTIRIRTEPGE